MLKLRTILLHDKLYYLIFIVVIIITIVNIKIPRTSIYDSTTTKVTGKGQQYFINKFLGGEQSA